MNDMEKLVEQGMLYDFYGELLTDHQKQIYEGVVFHDMSLSEIAQENGISRQGVHDLIKRCNKTLMDYEMKLHLVERFEKTKQTIKELSEEIRELEALETSAKYVNHISNMKQKIGDILEEL